MDSDERLTRREVLQKGAQVSGAVVALATTSDAQGAAVAAEGCLLVRGGLPEASIVVAGDAPPAVRFAAQELQSHIERMTGAQLPIVADSAQVKGPRILVGESAMTRRLGLRSDVFRSQEYLVRIRSDTIVLMGRDATTGQRSRANEGDATARTEPPGAYEEQGTCYAVYDFLERFCGVRWYAPGELGLICPKRRTLRVAGPDVRRAPAFKFRQGTYLPVYGMLKEIWDSPTAEEVRLFACRMRLGGQPYAANHSFYGYYDRFFQRNPQHPELFEAEHPEWFARGYSGQPPQMCYTNPGFIAQVIQDARDYFDGKGAKPGAQANGDFFALVPMDNSSWCLCPTCQAELNADEKNSPHFSNGWASDYIFGFANKVAREIGRTHPGKYLATLAYSSYAYYPRRTRLESNIAVQLCLHTRNWWAPAMERNDMAIYKSWTTKEKDRPIYLWLYYTFPEEIAMNQGWHCFPGFFAHTLDRQFEMFARDGIRGVFLNNLGEYLDSYLTFRLLDDPTLNVDRMIEEFHKLYYGAAAEPMRRLYLAIEATFCNPANYPETIRNGNRHEHQTEELAWQYLGTAERMAAFGTLMEEAVRLAGSEMEHRRVALFRRAIWDYMVEGRRMWESKQKLPPRT